MLVNGYLLAVRNLQSEGSFLRLRLSDARGERLRAWARSPLVATAIADSGSEFGKPLDKLLEHLDR